jgi:hypothetical protein
VVAHKNKTVNRVMGEKGEPPDHDESGWAMSFITLIMSEQHCDDQICGIRA